MLNLSFNRVKLHLLVYINLLWCMAKDEFLGFCSLHYEIETWKENSHLNEYTWMAQKSGSRGLGFGPWPLKLLGSMAKHLLVSGWRAGRALKTTNLPLSYFKWDIEFQFIDCISRPTSTYKIWHPLFNCA